MRALCSGRVLLGAGVVVALVAIAPSLASAKQTRLFAGSFGEATSTPANPYPLGSAGSLAVSAGSLAVDSSSHDVYVGDPQNFRVERFDASGHFLFMLGLEVNKTAVEESATRKSEENVCPAAGHPADVCQRGQPGATPGAFLNPAFLAVDNSSGPSRGDLYVANPGAENEEQTVTVTATSGRFTLSFEGETTGPIAFNAPVFGPGSVEGALHALAKTHFVQVAGSPGAYRITFLEAPTGVKNGGTNVPQMTCDGSALSAGGSCAVATTRQGFTAQLVEKFDASGLPVTTWGEGGELNGSAVTSPPDPVAGPFAAVAGIAVDTSGNLWVSGGTSTGHGQAGGVVFEFGNDGGFLTGWIGDSGGLTVDAIDNLYFSNDTVDGFDSVGKEIGIVAPSARESVEDNFTMVQGGEALDIATDSLYVAGSEGFAQAGTRHGIVKRYDLSSCHPVITHEIPAPGCDAVEGFGGGLISPDSKHPVAVDPVTDAVYVGDAGHVTSFSFLTVPDVTSTKPTGPTSSSATLTGVIDPSGVELNPGVEGCRFEWGETAAPYEHTVACDKTAAQIGKGSEPVEVHAAITGLLAGRTYHYRLVAANANDVNASITEPSLGADVTFGPAHLENASVLDITATSATVQAEVNPNDLDTNVRVEYGTEAGVYPQSTLVSDVGSAGTVKAPTFELTGLAPGGVYYYRVVAENVLGEGPEAVISPEQTFITQTASAFSLPDNRGWELVSPQAKHGAILKGPSGLSPVQAAVEGNAISYTASSPTESGAAGNADNVQIVSARAGTGWSSRDIVTPNVVAHGGATPPEYKIFSSDLSLGIVEPDGAFAPEISPEASEQTPFLRSDFPAGNTAALCTVGCFRPLVTGAPGFANVPPGTKFGYEQNIGSQNGSAQTVRFLGASPDARHIVLSSTAPLVEGAPKYSLYEWTEGRLELVSFLPGMAGPVSNASATLGTNGETLGPTHGQQRTAVSADGSRVVWSESGGRGHLYLRDVPGEQTLQIDLDRGGSGKGPVLPVFQMASSDGSVILFTDEQQLTPGSGASLEHPDLYRCQVTIGESGGLECLLSDLSPTNGGEAANVKGMVGASTDGSSVYFVANGVLAHNQVDHGAGPEGAVPGGCGNSVLEGEGTATCNLYLYREGATIFIARFSSADLRDFNLEGPGRVSASGQWLALMSQRPLTGYDNRDRGSGRPVAEVYLYNAAAGPAGMLLCVSCNPSGARPHGIEYLQLASQGDNSLHAWPWGAACRGVPP